MLGPWGMPYFAVLGTQEVPPCERAWASLPDAERHVDQLPHYSHGPPAKRQTRE